jgi:hypothetical protein
MLSWVRHVAYTREVRSAYKILVENLKGKDHFGDVGVDVRSNNKMDLREKECKDVNWTCLAHDRHQQ